MRLPGSGANQTIGRESRSSLPTWLPWVYGFSRAACFSSKMPYPGGLWEWALSSLPLLSLPTRQKPRRLEGQDGGVPSTCPPPASTAPCPCQASLGLGVGSCSGSLTLSTLLHPCDQPRRSFRLLPSTWPSSGHCSHLGMDQWVENSLSNSDFQIISPFSLNFFFFQTQEC